MQLRPLSHIWTLQERLNLKTALPFTAIRASFQIEQTRHEPIV
jgi:hypothetical protein